MNHLGIDYKMAKQKDKDAMVEEPILQKIKEALEAEQPARAVELSDDEKKIIKGLHLLTIKQPKEPIEQPKATIEQPQEAIEYIKSIIAEPSQIPSEEVDFLEQLAEAYSVVQVQLNASRK